MHKSTLKRIRREQAIRKVAGTMPAWRIAKMFNVSEINLQGICSRAGISLAFYLKRFSEEDKARVVAARKEGMSLARIAKMVGRSEGSVSALLSHLKIRKGINSDE